MSECECPNGEYGYVHSIDTGSMVDGPGARVVVFLAGCPVRCAFCQNPDTWVAHRSQRRSATSVVGEISRYVRFLRAARGGVTLSGGEPLLQRAFAERILGLSKDLDLHTAMETTGQCESLEKSGLAEVLDLGIVDFKGFDESVYSEMTNLDLSRALRFCEFLAARNIPLWLTLVLIRGVTDCPEHLIRMGEWARDLGSVERILIRPIHHYGRSKWESLGRTYRFQESQSPSDEEVWRAQSIVNRAFGATPGPLEQSVYPSASI